jgi:glycosyltransferase involved in cell wall biosynthesis
MTAQRSEDKLRVLLFGRYADAEFGGIERHVRSLVEALRDDVQYVNLVEGRGLDAGPPWECPVVHTRSLAVIASQPLCPGMPFTVRRLQREHAFQIAHLHLPDPMSHLAALALPASVRFVLTWHSDIVKQRRLLQFYKPFLERLIARSAAVIAPTPAHFQSMPQLGALVPEGKRAVVPFGFDLRPFAAPHPKARELRASFGAKSVFALGRHVYYKGFEYLVRAMAQVPGAVLVLGGSGPLTDSLKAIAASAGVAERVRFVGRIAEPDLPAYYQACDVFCLPSVEPSEAFGIVQVEAMAAGKPVVCTQLGNGVNWVNPPDVAGLTVPPRDARALAQALRNLLSDDALRAQLGASAAKRAAEQFSLRALRDGTLAVYRRALLGAG